MKAVRTGGLWSAAFSAAAAAAVWLLLAAADARAQDAPVARGSEVLHACAGTAQVVVRAALATDARVACDGAQRALAFMAGAGLRLSESMTIDIVEQLPGDLRERAVGCYERETRRVLLLTYAAFEATGEWLRVPADRELYRSVAAHETAHAVVGCQSAPGAVPVPVHEYVAYVVMFATMEPPLRARVLARFPGQGFDSTLQINPVVYFSDPSRFAAEAWRHYLKRRSRATWLRDVISGGWVPEFPTEGP